MDASFSPWPRTMVSAAFSTASLSIRLPARSASDGRRPTAASSSSSRSEMSSRRLRSSSRFRSDGAGHTAPVRGHSGADDGVEGGGAAGGGAATPAAVAAPAAPAAATAAPGGNCPKRGGDVARA